MNELPQEYINQLCSLSEEDIYQVQVNPTELHQILVIAIEQIERNLQDLGVDSYILDTPNRRYALKARVSQLERLDSLLQYLNQ